MKITKGQLRRIIKEEIQRLTEQGSMPELQLTLGSSGEEPVLTHPEAYEEVRILDYASSEELMSAVSEMLGPYDETEVVRDEELGVGDMPLNTVYDTIIGMM